MHVVLFAVLFQRVHHLGVVAGAEDERRQHLGLAAREQAGAVDAREQADFAVNLPDVGRAAPVGPLAFGQDQVAELLLDGLVGGFLDVGDVVRVLVLQLVDDVVDQQGQAGLAGRLVRVLQARPQGRVEPLPDDFQNLGVDLVQGNFGLGLVDLGGQFALHGAELLAGFMREVHRFQHLLFGDFGRARFDHRDGVFAGGDDQVQRAFALLLETWG